MIKEFNNIEEIKKYYDLKRDAYVFKENNKFIDLVVFNFDLDIKADIIAHDIKACNITAYDIDVWDINANYIEADWVFAEDINVIGIKAYSIHYNAICFAYNNIECALIKGSRENAKHLTLDGKIIIKEK